MLVLIIAISSGALLPFILLAVVLVVGGAYTVVDFFFKYWIYFAIGSGILLLIRTITTAVKSFEKWQAFVYFIIEVIRIPLTYLTLVWYANDWITEAHSNILGFIIKAGVEGIFVLFFISMATTLPWSVFGNDDFAEDIPWVLPIISIVLIIIPLGLRMIVEYVNTGVAFPVELFSKMIF